eukprot:CAMPEP_0170500180 /NCGR_PEP_ID=MMETSP0208-20121228/34025_1 /TAXON_ID=197538 /ORGANISM="Strombidium inclinatum, Strain S3" /LENGTH=159 /DNA_ID=CAMNT_0010778095 /DNA_START=2186 /DNA_END=2665 /DNA_ORIENTATION=+
MFKNFVFLKKAWYLLRPINVAFKNKWLRDIAAKYTSSTGVGQTDKRLILRRVLQETGVGEVPTIEVLAVSILDKLKVVDFGCNNGYFDVCAVVATALKMLYAFNDVNWDSFHSLPQASVKLILSNLKDLYYSHEESDQQNEEQLEQLKSLILGLQIYFD